MRHQDKHLKVCNSMSGRLARVQLQSSSSPTVGRLTLQVFRVLPRNAHTIRICRGRIYPLVPPTVVGDFLTDSNLYSLQMLFVVFYLLLLLLSPKPKIRRLFPHWEVMWRHLI